MDAPRLDSLRDPALVQPDDAGVRFVDLLTWLGQGKRAVAVTTLVAAAASLAYSLTMAPVFTARTALLPPAAQQNGPSAALAALGALGGLAGGLGGGLASKTPDELYVSLLKSDSVVRALDQRFNLRDRLKVRNHEALRKVLPNRVRVNADKKSGLITVEVDDGDPKFAAELANAHHEELAKVLSRLAVSEAQQRRMFYEQHLTETKENLVRAEQEMQKVQEKSGVIVLDKQAEALIGGAAQLRALIAEREVRLKVLRTAATEQNPDVVRLASELAALRAELARMESRRDTGTASPVDMPVGRIPAAAVDYVRARRELKIQETILEGMLRQYEVARLDEAKEGPGLQLVDKALPPDYKSKPSRAMFVVVCTLLGLLGAAVYVMWRGYAAFVRTSEPRSHQAWQAMREAWRLRRR
ncbi:MAG TPA: Wzz/FepE/Etk N-terminal domain-containing protein [Albitalea sp.]